jgi:hypothetical protein
MGVRSSQRLTKEICCRIQDLCETILHIGAFRCSCCPRSSSFVEGAVSKGVDYQTFPISSRSRRCREIQPVCNRMKRTLLSHLVYLFWPPPRLCHWACHLSAYQPHCPRTSILRSSLDCPEAEKSSSTRRFPAQCNHTL